MLIAGIVLLVIGVVLVFVFRSQQAKLSAVLGTEMTTVANLKSLYEEYKSRGGGPFHYQAELQGTAELNKPLVSEIAGQQCVYYRMQVEREWEEEYWERDSEGRRERRTRRGSDTMAQNERSEPFLLRDSTGTVTVDPRGAETDAVQVADQFQPGETGVGGRVSFGGFSIAIGAMLGSGRRTLGYHFREWAIPVGQMVYVLATARDLNGEMVVGQSTDGKNRFMLSHRSEQEILRSLRTTLLVLQIAIAVCIVGGIGLIIGGVVGQ